MNTSSANGARIASRRRPRTRKRLSAEKQWYISTSGFLYEPYGSWQVEGLNQLLLAKKSMEPMQYQASFKDGDLYLTDDKGQFTVLKRCD